MSSLREETTRPAGGEESGEGESRVNGAVSFDDSRRGVSKVPGCLVCARSELKKIYRTPHQDLLRCRHCGLVFGWPVFSQGSLLEYNEISFRGEGLPETADFFHGCRNRANGGSLLGQYRRGLARIQNAVPTGKLLDVGCGVPVFLRLAQSAGYSVRGIDPIPEASRIGHDEFGLAVETATFDQSDLEVGSFDVITMWDFLEHVPDPMATLRRARELLRPGGVLFVSAPNYRSVLHGSATLLAKFRPRALRELVDKLYHFSHVCIWSPRAIAVALAVAGLSPLEQGVASPALDRYRLSPPMRAGLTLVDAVGRITGLRSRLWVLASATRGARAGE